MSKKRDNPKQEFSEIYSLLKEFVYSINGIVYKIMSDDEFKKLTKIEEVQYIYWIEIIQRTHFCGVTSIQRVFKWLDSVNISFRENNYYGFCASLRGLIEACADSFYTSGKICTPLASNFGQIEKALNFKATGSLLSESIENELIHYTFGRKLSSDERRNTPESHKALNVIKYLDSLNEPKIKELYSELCQVSHPSTMSLEPFFYADEEHDLILHNQKNDANFNQRILDEYRTEILLAIRYAIVPAIGLLKIINEFKAESIESLKVNDILFLYIGESDFLKDLMTEIEKSKYII